jgi:hypothetical protein
MPEWFGSLISTLLGAGVALFAVERAHSHNLALKKWETDREIDGVLVALDTELTICSDEYFARMGPMIDAAPEGKPFLREFALQLEYTLTYKNNIHIIGRLENEPLRKTIINTHLQWAFLFEALYSNTRGSQALREWGLRGIETTDPELKRFYKYVSEQIEAGLRTIPERLKKQQALCKQLTQLQSAAIADYRANHPITKPKWFDLYAQ